MTIQKITLSDIPDIAKIEAEIQADPWTEGMFKDTLNAGAGNEGFVIKKDNLICAYLLIQMIVDECHILTIGVKKEYQHQGLATKLLTYLESTYLSSKPTTSHRLLLEVRESNKPAIKLYQKLNFQLLSFRKDYYKVFSNQSGDNENALIYEKYI